MDIFPLVSDDNVRDLRLSLYPFDVRLDDSSQRSIRADAFTGVLEHVRQNLGARSVIVEPDYIDRDFMDEYSFFYSKTFRKYDNRCVRLHFFSAVVDAESVTTRRLVQGDYLGFCILRPTDYHRVGRTVLRPSPSAGVFALCQATFKVNLYGNSLTVKGTPFMQQDKQVGACAHVCLWMAMRYLHQSDGYTWYSTVDIAKKATAGSVRGNDIPVGKGGLDLQQLTNAVRQLGMQPLVYVKQQKQPYWPKRPQEIIYRYVESGLPVILLFISEGTGHAVCATGHTYDYEHSIPTCNNNVAFVPQILIHNDEEGPYRKVPLWGPQALNDLESILVLLPNKVFLKGEDAESKAQDQVIKLNPTYIYEYGKLVSGGEVSGMLATAHEKFRHAFAANEIFYRTYLARSNDFKDSIVANQSMSETAKHVYCHQSMPRYIWVTELSTQELLGVANPNHRQMLGEIVQDATANTYDYTLLAAHFPGCLITIDPNATESKQDAIPITDDRVYPHLAR